MRSWRDPGSTSVLHSLFSAADPTSWTCSVVAREPSGLGRRGRATAWLPPRPAPLFSRDLGRLVVILSTQQGEAGSFPHLALFR